MAGLFISFEGVDGVGKSTQAERLRDYLRSRGLNVVLTREPGGTRIGAAIRQILLHGVDGDTDIAPRTEALLYAADRAQHAAHVIRPALDAGDVVISDRYIDSSLAYQAGGRELTPDDIRNLSEWATGGLWPRRTYVLDMDFADSAARLTGEADRLESSGRAFFSRTRQEFLALAQADPERFRVIDASRSIEEVWDDIRRDVDGLVPDALPRPAEMADAASARPGGAR
ncbi:MAG: dTMP kinase [Bifidobacteriaceae bacterium]|nr:dTMP kinase [Bifidobacteriaceae bacterium]